MATPPGCPLAPVGRGWRRRGADDHYVAARDSNHRRFDAFLATLVALMLVMMSVGTAQQCALMAKQKVRIRHSELIAAVVATLVGIAAIGVMLHSQRDEARWLRTVHLGGSLLALLLGWIAAQVTFAIQYMRAYYGNQQGRASIAPSRA
jgi:uncharacterized membrane protein